MTLLVPCPGCGENRKADEGHALCRSCEYGPRPSHRDAEVEAISRWLWDNRSAATSWESVVRDVLDAQAALDSVRPPPAQGDVRIGPRPSHREAVEAERLLLDRSEIAAVDVERVVAILADAGLLDSVRPQPEAERPEPRYRVDAATEKLAALDAHHARQDAASRPSPAQDDEEMVPLRTARKAVKAAQNEAKAQRAAAQEGLTADAVALLDRIYGRKAGYQLHDAGMFEEWLDREVAVFIRKHGSFDDLLRRLASTDRGETDG